MTKPIDARVRENFLNVNCFHADKRNKIADYYAAEEFPFRKLGHMALGAVPRDEALALAERFRDKPTTAEGSLRHYALADILAQPELRALSTSPAILSAVSMWLGAPPKILAVSMWRSLPSDDQMQAQSWHRDMDDWRFCKLFCYLTDVDADSGPHQMLEGSHLRETFERMGVPPDRYFVAASRDKFTMDETEVMLPTVEFVGSAGSCFLVNTYALHRGKPGLKRERMVFQALFGLRDMGAQGTNYEEIKKAWFAE